MISVEEYNALLPHEKRGRLMAQRSAYRVQWAQMVDKPAFDAWVKWRVERLLSMPQFTNRKGA